MSLDLEYFPKFKCCFNQHLCLGENSSKCPSKIFRTESSLAQDEIQNLTQLWSPLPSPFIGGILSHRVAFPSLFASLENAQTSIEMKIMNVKFFYDWPLYAAW